MSIFTVLLRVVQTGLRTISGGIYTLVGNKDGFILKKVGTHVQNIFQIG